MSAALLDLSAHGLDDIPGKYIVINGARYTIGELIGEGGESTVFRIRNDATKLSIFVLKINRFLPGSPEFEETRNGRAQLLFALKGGMASEADPTNQVLVPDEIYEQNGGLIDLQRNVDGVSDPDYFATEVRQVWDLYTSGRHAEALAASDAVLAKNPNHTYALRLKASCLSRTDRIFDGIDLLERAIELEPNDAHTYHFAG